MSTRSWVVAGCTIIMAGCFVALTTGCAGSHRTGRTKMASQGIAPDDVALHPNPNAPYIIAGGTPKLIRRAAATVDTSNAGPCDPGALSVEEIAADTNGTYRSVKLAFMNRGTVACVLGGYPEVSLLSPTGEVIGNIVTEQVTRAQVVAELARPQAAPASDPVPQVMLLPHEVAAFQVVWAVGPECTNVARIAVRAPGTQQFFSIPQPLKVCTGRIQVTALHPDEGNI